MICLPPKLNQSFFVYSIQNKENLQKKSFSRKRASGGLNENQKEDFLTYLASAIKNNPVV